MSSKILIIGLDQVGATIGLALARADGDVLRLGFDPDKKIAKAAMNLAEMLKLTLIEGVSSINKRLLDETSTGDRNDSMD